MSLNLIMNLNFVSRYAGLPLILRYRPDSWTCSPQAEIFSHSYTQRMKENEISLFKLFDTVEEHWNQDKVVTRAQNRRCEDCVCQTLHNI